MVDTANQDPERKLDLEDPYEDDDYNIYFDKNSLLEFLNFLEDDNLFKIYLVDENQQYNKKLFAESKEKYEKQYELIAETTSSID